MPTLWIPINPPVIKSEDEPDIQKDSDLFPGTHMQFHVKQYYMEYMEISADLPVHFAFFGLPDPPGIPHPPPGIPEPPRPPLPPGVPSIPVPPPGPPGGILPPIPPGVPIPPGPPHPTGKTEWRKIDPRVRTSADIHMTPAAVESMKDNEQLFADVMKFVGGPTALFFELGHAVYAYGLAHAKNDDGSLDIHIDPTGAKAGNHLILLPVSTCMAIIQIA